LAQSLVVHRIAIKSRIFPRKTKKKAGIVQVFGVAVCSGFRYKSNREKIGGNPAPIFGKNRVL
jgi:hypothetical protein